MKGMSFKAARRPRNGRALDNRPAKTLQYAAMTHELQSASRGGPRC